jgi:hypothetical protein
MLAGFVSFAVDPAAAQVLDHLNLATNPAFAVDHLAAFFGPHAGAEADFTSAFDIAGFVGVMHE